MAEKELKTTEDVFDENMRLAELERNRLKGIKNPTKKEKPFYVSELPEGVQNKLKDMQKRKLLDEGYSEEEAEYYADEFLNEKVYTAEEFYGNNFWEKPEFADKPTSEEPKDEEPSMQDEVRWKTPDDLNIPTMSDEDLSNSIDGIERGQSDLTDAEKPIALGWIKDEMAKRKSKSTDEMADFQKSLDDYASKNKKGRDDIPVTTRR